MGRRVLPLLPREERESSGLAWELDARIEGESEESGAREGAVVVDVGFDHDPLRARLREQEGCDRVGDAGGEPSAGAPRSPRRKWMPTSPGWTW